MALSLQRYKKIKKEILKLKPKDVKVRYLQRKTHSYDIRKQTCYIGKLAGRVNLLHGLLHEMCHSMTKPQMFASKPNFKFTASINYDNKVVCQRPNSLFYLNEYKAEKLLRKICRQHNWNNILTYSNKTITYLTTLTHDSHIIKYNNVTIFPIDKIIDNFLRNYVMGYIYMAKRISREENLCINT